MQWTLSSRRGEGRSSRKKAALLQGLGGSSRVNAPTSLCLCDNCHGACDGLYERGTNYARPISERYIKSYGFLLQCMPRGLHEYRVPSRVCPCTADGRCYPSVSLPIMFTKPSWTPFNVCLPAVLPRVAALPLCSQHHFVIQFPFLYGNFSRWTSTN